MRRGFGSTDRVHGKSFTGLMSDVEGHLDSAERVLRGGDCEAGVESTLMAERIYGEARAHYASRSVSAHAPSPRGWLRLVDATKRLNFLRQALKRCVRD